MLTPARTAAAVTPSNSTANYFAFLRIGVAGDIKVDTIGGSVGVTIAVLAGEYLPLSVTKVYATGTTATGIIGFS